MQPISVSEIIEAVGGELLGEGDLALTVSCVDTDSRKIRPDSLFIPLVGERFDGHAYINDALSDGAVVSLTQRERENYLPGKCYIKVASTQRALMDLAYYYKKKFSIPMIAVTGSVGKTTTKDMIAAVLSEKYCVLKTEGNWNNHLGVPLTLLRLMPEHEVAVIELGMNHAGEIDELARLVEPQVAVITNVGDAHIENLGSREGILLAKSEIFPHLAKDGFGVLNGDDELLTTLRGRIAQDIVWVGGTDGVDYRALSVESDGERYVHCEVAAPGGGCQLQIPALGVHMVYPALTAMAVGERLGLSREQVINGVLRFAPTKMRMNVISRGGITILDDAYNANPQSMRAAVDVLAKTRGARKVAVLGDMFELGQLSADLHAGVGDFLGRSGVDCLVAVGEHAEHLAKAAEAAGMPEVYWRPTKKEAMTVLEQIMLPDTTFLVKASRGMQFEELTAFLISLLPEK